MELKQVNLICFKQAYPIDISQFNKHSNFKFNENTNNINLLNEFDIYTCHTEESIKTFLNYCQDQPYELKVSNVISINALSEKYLVNELQKETEEFIEKNYTNVIEFFLSSNDAKNTNESPKYEELISTHFDEYSSDDRLFNKQISVLHRIQMLVLSKIKKEESNSSTIKNLSRALIDFLIKSVSIFGDDSSIFFSLNKFNREQIIYLNERMDNIDDENIKEILTEFLHSNSSFIIEYQKNEKLKYENDIKIMKEEFESTIKQLKDEISFLFCNLDSNKPINMPNSSIKIFKKQFERYPFKELILPNNITNIEEEAFNECSLLTKITIPFSVTSIGSRSFRGCKSLKEITIPSSVKKIGEKVFEGCKILKISENMTEIPNNLFNGCSSLIRITIPSSVTSIGERSFSNCESLKEIVIPSSVTSIGSRSFSGCKSLKEITIPSSVKKIGENIFEGCEKLKISENMTEIPNNLFNGCSSLKEIIIPTSTKYDKNIFKDCSKEIKISYEMHKELEKRYKNFCNLGKEISKKESSNSYISIANNSPTNKNARKEKFQEYVGTYKELIDEYPVIKEELKKSCQSLHESLLKERENYQKNFESMQAKYKDINILPNDNLNEMINDMNILLNDD